MTDYTYPSVLFAYLMFFILTSVTGYFLFRSVKAGYWGKNSEEPKFRMLEDDPLDPHTLPNGANAPRRN